MSTKILALHLSSRRLCAARAEATIGSFKLLSLSDAEFDGNAAIPEFCKDSWDRVIATLPAETALYRFLDLPFRDRRRLGQAVGPALEEHVPLSLDEATTAYDFTDSRRRGPVLAAMAANSAIEKLGNRLSEWGLSADRIVWAPCATLEIYRRSISYEDKGTVAIVDASVDGATIGVLGGEALLDLRVIGACDDALLSRNVLYALRSMKTCPRRIVLGGPRAAAIAQNLNRDGDHFSIEQLPERCPLEGVDDARWRTCAPAVGLLFAATGGIASPLLDFSPRRSGTFGRWSELSSELRPLLPWAGTALGLALLASTVSYVRLASERAELRKQSEAVFAKAMPGMRQGKGARLKMEMRLRELNGARATPGGASVTPLTVLALMSQAVPKDVDVEFDGFYVSGNNVRLNGNGASFEAVTLLQQALIDSGHFGEVEVKDVHAAAGGNGVAFQLLLEPLGSASLRGGAKG